MQVPDFHREIIPGDQVATVVTELGIRYAGDDLGEEALVGWVLWLLKHWNSASGVSFSKCVMSSSDLNHGKTMVTKVISEFKSISRLKIFRETGPWS